MYWMKNIEWNMTKWLYSVGLWYGWCSKCACE